MSRESDDQTPQPSPAVAPAFTGPDATASEIREGSNPASAPVHSEKISTEPEEVSAPHTATARADSDPVPASEKIGAVAEASQATEEVSEAPAEAMDKLMEQYAVAAGPAAEGEIFDGRVLAISDSGVVVDVGGKFEGLVPRQEFLDAGGAIPFGPGQTIEVERLHERREGYVLLSHVRAHRRRVWERIENSYREHAPLKAKVIDRIKGGLVVDIGMRAFLPASQLELRPVHDLESWKDCEIECRVLKVNRKRGNVVVSRRAILEDELKVQREALMARLEEGAVVTGKVKNITDYGVFVDLGGLDGLLHVSDLVWGRVPHPSTLIKAGEEIQVQILRFDKEKMRISLGRKQLLPDPWASVPERFPPGTRVRGKVVGITDYGAFMQLEPGVEGLVHVSEMSWSKRIKHPSKIVKEGEEVEVVVLDVKPEQRRISLGLKQTLPDPWQSIAEKYPAGSILSGRVRNLTEFGAFLEIEEGVEGLIHISDMSWTGRVKHPGEKVKKGETVQAKVLKVDVEHRRLSLGLKQVNDIWANWFAAHPLNEVVKGKVVRIADFGAFVELSEGIEGLCHISEIEERRPKGEREKLPRAARAAAVLVAGQEYEFKIIRLEPELHKISLSFRAAQKQAEHQELEIYGSAKSSPTATIGDAILAKRQSS